MADFRIEALSLFIMISTIRIDKHNNQFQYIHANNITHRDIKPENILLADQRDHTLVKVSY